MRFFKMRQNKLKVSMKKNINMKFIIYNISQFQNAVSGSLFSDLLFTKDFTEQKLQLNTF